MHFLYDSLTFTKYATACSDLLKKYCIVKNKKYPYIRKIVSNGYAYNI